MGDLTTAVEIAAAAYLDGMSETTNNQIPDWDQSGPMQKDYGRDIVRPIIIALADAGLLKE